MGDPGMIRDVSGCERPALTTDSKERHRFQSASRKAPPVLVALVIEIWMPRAGEKDDSLEPIEGLVFDRPDESFVIGKKA